MTALSALTVWQPWATLLILGLKPWEYRPWKAPRAYVGQRIVIHAAARPVRVKEVVEIEEALGAGRVGLVGEGCTARTLELLDQWHREGPATLFGGATTSTFPIAAGLGTVLLGEPITAADLWSAQADVEDIDPDKWAWPVFDPQPFDAPIPAKGEQGFWRWKATP